ncbi:winged helix-turn-helix domain-containing protein [Tenacibaculum sp. ZS6-P6]|uniref:winged helix-turn-helix domain-containing protein n=1 Tax=Tenacibaculum sp. ZS6-P6 TaxID=3447503 RepID=UPI003F9E2AE1
MSLRQVGHELLIANKDLTSPVLPVKKIDDTTYELAFPNTIEIEPSKLVKLIETNFKKAKLPEAYIVQVFQCIDNEVAYSYLMQQEIQEGIIPCANRILAKSCYTIRINFTGDLTTSSSNYKSLYFIVVLLIVVTIILLLLFKKKQQKNKNIVVEQEVKLTIGNYSFLPDRNILIRNSSELNLSKKECDLLLILVENLNQTVKREELTKKVWEDNGVVVSRSLDTYISKLRKKLAEDETIKITNVHGVGYKLIVK